MRYSAPILLLLLVSCSTPLETSVNGGTRVFWGAPNEGMQFFYTLLKTRVLAAGDTSQSKTSDTTTLLASTVDGTQRIEYFKRAPQLFSQQLTIVQLDANGTITLADPGSSNGNADTLRYALGGLPFTIRTSTVDSIANGDTITLGHIIRYYGRDLPNVPQETGPVPHILDSTYFVRHGTPTTGTISAFNLWFVPELGGIYAKYIEDDETIGESPRYVTECDLVRYSR